MLSKVEGIGANLSTGIPARIFYSVMRLAPSRVRMRMWRGLYQRMARSQKDSNFRFMNYGFTDGDELKLSPEDEGDRLFIQLYNMNIRDVEIGGKEVLEFYMRQARDHRGELPLQLRELRQQAQLVRLVRHRRVRLAQNFDRLVRRFPQPLRLQCSFLLARRAFKALDADCKAPYVRRLEALCGNLPVGKHVLELGPEPLRVERREDAQDAAAEINDVHARREDGLEVQEANLSVQRDAGQEGCSGDLGAAGHTRSAACGCHSRAVER